jgi:predicted ATPase
VILAAHAQALKAYQRPDLDIQKAQVDVSRLIASVDKLTARCESVSKKDFVISFKGPAGAGKTALMTEAVAAIESLPGRRHCPGAIFPICRSAESSGIHGRRDASAIPG